MLRKSKENHTWIVEQSLSTVDNSPHNLLISALCESHRCLYVFTLGNTTTDNLQNIHTKYLKKIGKKREHKNHTQRHS